MKNHTPKIDKAVAQRLFLVLVGIIVNIFLGFAAHSLKLPLYLDTIGTILTVGLGGLFMGIVVAVSTNVLCGLFNPFSVYYMLISILIACFSANFINRGRFRARKHIPVYILFLAVSCGTLSTAFQWILLGQPQFEDVRTVSEALSSATGISLFICAVVINIGLNLVDKGLTTGIAILVLHFIPEEKKNEIWYSSWRQKPLSDKEIRKINGLTDKREMSIQRRLTEMLMIAAISIAVIMSFISFQVYSSNLKEQYSEGAEKAAMLAVSVVNADRIDEYIQSGEKAGSYDGPGYQKTNELLSKIKGSIPGITYLYIYQIREEGCYIAFDTDESYQESGVLGELLPFDESFLEYVPALLRGEKIDTLENNDTYGFFMTAYEPIYDSEGRCVAYAGADASLTYVADYTRNFLMRVIFVFSGFFILILGYGFWMSRFRLIYPINSMAMRLDGFMQENEEQEELDEDVKEINALKIRTGDEVELLYRAICRMAAATAEQMRDIRHYADATAQMQNGLIITMADMVENRDKDTGAHVQKTSEYVRIILNGLKRKGYYASKLTPKYISDVVMSAPLHDVGKINIPDAILNKPGKLTDEEYEIMKTHTTAGKQIMERAISTVNGENYLKEARNMAAYHHERWDGKGYPEGLHGEVIPLSARVMSVADVFDALTSARIYKPPFPVEKALEIISDGAGTQFDPKVVEVFMDSLNEVRIVLKKYQDA